jgi:hypothetical protein
MSEKKKIDPKNPATPAIEDEASPTEDSRKTQRASLRSRHSHRSSSQ